MARKQRKIHKALPMAMGILIIILAFAAGYRECSRSGSSRLVEDYRHPGGDTLAVAIEMSPLTYNIADDTIAGFDYEIISDIASRHSLPVKFYPVAQLDKAFLGLRDGEYDMVVASMPATKKLREYFPLTEAVYLDRQVLVQRRDSATGEVPVPDPRRLMGDTVWIAEGSPYRTRLSNLAGELGDTIYVETLPGYSAEHLAILTAVGELPRAVVGEAVARRIADDYPQLDISTPISLSQIQTWAVAPGDSVLLDSLNSWLAEFRHTPAYPRLVKKYLDR